MKKIKVTQFVTSLFDGGAETLVKDYALLVDKSIFDVEVLALYDCGRTANYKRLADAGVKITFILKASSNSGSVLRRVFRSAYIITRILIHLKKRGCNVLHIHLALLKYISAIRLFIKRTKILYTCHNVPDKYFTGENEKEYLAARKLIKDNNLQVIALHNKMKEELDKMLSINNTVVLRNGVDFDKFKHPNYTKKEMREKLHISYNAFVVGHVGRFVEAKNHAFLVRVFESVYAQNNDSFLLMIGDGPLVESVIKQINAAGIPADKYLILSNRPDMPDLYSSMDVFLFPSLYEGAPISLVEAQVSGLRCIISSNIDKESVYSRLTRALSLDDELSSWRDAVLDKDFTTDVYFDESQIDSKKIISELEKLYGC